MVWVTINLMTYPCDNCSAAGVEVDVFTGNWPMAGYIFQHELEVLRSGKWSEGKVDRFLQWTRPEVLRRNFRPDDHRLKDLGSN